MRPLLLASAALALTLAGSGGRAEEAATADFNRLDAIASCYRLLNLPAPAAPPQRAFYLLIDQTTVFDESLRQTVLNAAIRNLRPATEINVATFSAFVGNHYTEVVLAARLDTPLSQAERDDTGKSKLRALDQCQARQLDYARQLLQQGIRKAFGGASAEIARSDILASIADFAAHAIAPSSANSKVLLLASDMLENSAISSFYAAGKLRRIEPPAELARVHARDLVPSLKAVRIYVIGAGLLQPLPSDRTASYRDPRSVEALESFWNEYFREGGAEVVEFGKPQLLRSVD